MCVCAFRHVDVSQLKHVDMWICVCVCVLILSALKCMRHLCYTNAPPSVWVFPRCGWCVDHVVQSARSHTGSIILGSSLDVALNLHWVKEWFTSSERPFRHIWGTEEEYARPTPCRQNQVFSVWLGTAPSISPVYFLLPRIKWARCNISALMTCRQDNQSSMPKNVAMFVWRVKKRGDDVFITMCNWFSCSTIKGCCDKLRHCRCTRSFFNCSARLCFYISADNSKQSSNSPFVQLIC